jgi:hypothetical protein
VGNTIPHETGLGAFFVISHHEEETEMDIQIQKAKTTDVSAISDLLWSLNLFAHINDKETQTPQERVLKCSVLFTSEENALRNPVDAFGISFQFPSAMLLVSL